MREITIALLVACGAASAQVPTQQRNENATVGVSARSAGDYSNYRGFQFGMNLAAAVKHAGADPAGAKLVHQRPALIQEIDSQPYLALVAGSGKADPMKDALLSFYNDQLFRIVVTYDRYQLEGMTTEDMVERISTTYGPATKPAAEIAYHSNYGEAAPVIARWEDSDFSYNLVRTGDQHSFALVMYSKQLDTLAQAAIVAALRLDAQEAPRRDLEKKEKQDEASRLALEKARSLNKSQFRP